MWYYALFAVQIWLSYQALWDLQADYLYGKLGSGLDCWMKALEDIKSVFDFAYFTATEFPSIQCTFDTTERFT